MIQQISTISANVPSAGQTPGGTQDTDQFRSMLKAAVGQSDPAQGAGGSGSARKTTGQDSKTDKTGGRKKERTTEADQSDPDGTNTGQTMQSALPPETLISPDAAAAFASAKGQLVFQGKDQAVELGGSGPDSTAAVQASAAGIPSQAGEKSPREEKGQSEKTEQAFPLGSEAGRASGKGSAVSGTAERTASEQSAQNSGPSAAASADSGSRKFQSPDFKRQAGSTGPGSSVREAQKPSDAQRDSRMTGAEGKISSTGSDASDGTAQSPQTGAAQAHPPDAKDSGTDGTAASNGGLPALYGNGKVVIKVSGEPEQAQSSPARQVADTVMHQMQSGKTEFQMDLYPKSLGKVSVKLTSQDGLLTVEIAASDPKTQSLLLSGSSEIRSILQASTGQNVQTVTPDQQAAQWYGQQSSDGGDASGNRRQKRDEPRGDKSNGVESVSAELNTGDFLSMIQQISAYAR